MTSTPAPAPGSPFAERLAFAREFLRSPVETASLVPSAPATCDLLAAPVPATGDPVVVELGPGTGPVTDVVQRRLGGRGTHIAVELNGRLAEGLAQRHPGVDVVCDDARAVPALLAGRGLRADVVISGLPWAAYEVEGPSLPEQLAGAMAPDGVLTQIGYAVTRWLPPARRQRADFRAVFEELTVTRTQWSNVPPAVVYLARRPRRA